MSNFFFNNKKNISFFGDMHPDYAGSVVKALASSKDGVESILSSFKGQSPKGCAINKIKNNLKATIVSIESLAPKIIEIIIHAPLACQNFRPGQFYKLQNFETTALEKNKEIPPLLEPLALTGAFVDRQKNHIALIVLQSGTSSDLCETLSPGEEVVLMGPTGEATEIPKSKNVLLLGGGLGNAVLFSIAASLKENNCNVSYFAAYKTMDSRFKINEIEKGSDHIFWICEDGNFIKNREQDYSFKGNIVEALFHYQYILKDIDHIIAIGSNRMMEAVAKTRFHTLKKQFKKNPPLIGSINSPMQCMMKGICGQCVQIHKDSLTNKETVVFSCVNQDQNLETLDFQCLDNRLNQNKTQEKVNRAFMKSLL